MFLIFFIFIFSLYNVFNSIFSEICGSDHILENELAEENEANQINIEALEVDTDSQSVNSELQSIFEASDDSRPNSRASSRPNSSLNQSSESQNVR